MAASNVIELWIVANGADVDRLQFCRNLEGNALTFGRDTKTHLTIEGGQMSGRLQNDQD